MKYRSLSIIIFFAWCSVISASPQTMLIDVLADTYISNATKNEIGVSYGDDVFMDVHARSRKYALLKFDIPDCLPDRRDVELHLNRTHSDVFADALIIRQMNLEWTEDSSWASLFGVSNATLPQQMRILDDSDTDHPLYSNVSIFEVDDSGSYLIDQDGSAPTIPLRTRETANSKNLPETILAVHFDGPVVGDSNQDNTFDSGDYVAVFQAGKYESGEPASFAEGDWNYDCYFDSADIVYANIFGNYQD